MSSLFRGKNDAKDDDVNMQAAAAADSAGSKPRFSFNIPKLQAAMAKPAIPNSPRDNLTSKSERQPSQATSKSKSPHQVKMAQGSSRSEAQKEDVDRSSHMQNDSFSAEVDNDARDDDQQCTAGNRPPFTSNVAIPSRVTEGQAAVVKPPKFNFNIPSLSKIPSNKPPSNTLTPPTSKSSSLTPPQAKSLLNGKLQPAQSAALSDSTMTGMASPGLSSRATVPAPGKNFSNWKVEQSPPLSARSARSESAVQIQHSRAKSPPLSARSESAMKIHNAFSNSPPTSARSQPPLCKSPSSDVLTPSSSKASLTAQVEGKLAGVAMQAKTLSRSPLSCTSVRSGTATQSVSTSIANVKEETDDDEEPLSLGEPDFDVAGQMKLIHEQIHHMTRELGDMQKEVDMLNQSIDHGAANVEELEEQFRNDLQKVRNELCKNLADINDEHQEKHAETADALESGLAKVIEDLQAELSELRSGFDGSPDSMKDILGNVTRQVETLTSSVDRERELRMAVEAKLEKMSAELRGDLQGLLAAQSRDPDGKPQDVSDGKPQDVSQALQTGGGNCDLAELSKLRDEMTQQVMILSEEIQVDLEARTKSLLSEQQTVALELRKDLAGVVNDCAILKLEVQTALKCELQQSLSTLREELEVHANSLNAKHREIQDSLNTISDEQQETRADLEDVLRSSHARLEEDFQLLRSGGADSLEELRKTLTDVTQQVGNLENAARTEHGLRVAVEAKVDKLLSSQDKVISELREDVQDAVNELHSALKSELADYTRNNDEVRAATAEGHSALKEELQEALSAVQGELAAHVKCIEDKHLSIQDSLKTMSDEHHEIHALNTGKFEAGHNALKEQLQLLKSGREGSLQDLQKGLIDVTQQVVNLDQHVDTLEQATSKEHDMRMVVEAKVDKMLSEQAAQSESHAALRSELTAHGDEVRVALAGGHAALKEELQQSLSTVQAELNTMLSEVTQQVEAQMNNILSEQDKTVVGAKKEVMVKVEESHEALKRELVEHGSANDKIKAEMSHWNAAFKEDLQKKGEQISKLEAQLYDDMKMALDSQLDMVKRMEEDLREKQNVQSKNVERLSSDVHSLHSNTFNEMQHDFRELRSNSKDNHATLQKTLTNVNKQVDALTIALQRRVTQDGVEKLVTDLRRESAASFKEVHTSLQTEFVAQVSSKIAESEKQHRFEIEKTANDSAACQRLLQAMSDKQAAKHSAYDQRILALESSSNEKKEVQGTLERRLSHVEQVFTDTNDKQTKEVESVHSKFCEMLSMLNTQRSAVDNNKAIVEQRLEALGRAVAEVADSYSHALRDCRAELSKELAQHVKGERTSREALECSFVDYVQEARVQNQKLETKVVSYLRQCQTNQPVSISLESPPGSPRLGDRNPKVESVRLSYSGLHSESSPKLGSPHPGSSPKPGERPIERSPIPGQRTLGRTSLKPGDMSPLPPGERSPKLSSSSRAGSFKPPAQVWQGMTRSSSLQLTATPGQQCRIISPKPGGASLTVASATSL